MVITEIAAYDDDGLLTSRMDDREKVSVQLAGSDQWGNIVAGVDLIRRLRRQEAFALTAPLLLRADRVVE